MTLRPLVLALAAALALPLAAQAAKFTYHGDLMDGDAPAEGAYDLRVRAFAQPGASKALAEPTELPGVTLNEGRFSVELDLPEDADGTTWLEVAVRKAGSSDPFEKLGDPQPISKANSTCPGAWALDGNSGMPAGSFLGTVDANAVLELKAGDRRAVRIVPAGNSISWGDAPNIALGSSGNVAGGVGIVGATVSGGGAILGPDEEPCAIDCTNRATGPFSTIGGGQGNQARSASVTIAGGYFNQASETASTVGGGQGNVASGPYSTVAGGGGNEAEAFNSNIAGGSSNLATGAASAVGGGSENVAAGLHSLVPGGEHNCAGGAWSWAGGRDAKVRPGADPSTLLTACDGLLSYSADADGDEGTFVWADFRSGIPFVSTGPNQFLVRSAGGVAFNGTPANAGFELSVFGNDPDSGFVEVLLTPKPSLNGNTGESIEFGAGRGGAGNNDASFRITQRNALGGFVQTLTIGSDGVTNVKNGAVGNVSDARLKKNIGGIQQPLDTLLALRGHVFEYIDPAKSMNTPGPRMGFIAQEVQQTLPNWVTPHDNGYLQVSTIGFEALAVEAIRDLKTESDLRIEALESEKVDSDLRVKALEAQLSAVLRRLDRIKSRRER